MADEVPFDIPDTWEWVRLVEVCEYIQRGKSPKYSPIPKYPVIAQKCNQWSGFSIEKAQFIDPTSLTSYGPERLLQDEDLLWNSTGLGTLGRIAVYRAHLNPYELAVADSHVTVIRPLKTKVLPQYLYYYFANPTVQSVIEDKADGTTKQKELATATIKAYLVPIPPLEEQYRIIAKIAEVLPALEEYNLVEKKNSALNQTFPDRLKKSILQMAVQGKLVPQDPADEPAETLLARIREEKQRLVREGKIKKDKQESIIFRRDNSHYEKWASGEVCIDDMIPFEIPNTWAWVRLRSVLKEASTGPFGSMLHKDDYTEKGIPIVNPANITDRQITEIKIKRVSTETADRLKSFLLHSGDVIIGRRGEMGRSAVVTPQQEGWLCGTGCFFVAPFPVLSPEYLSFLLSSPYIRNALTESSVGTTMNNLNHSILGDLLIPLPPISEQILIMQQYRNVISIIGD